MPPLVAEDPPKNRSKASHGGLSLRANFLHLIAGRGIAAASQWAILVVMAKLVAAAVVGQYAFAVAVCLPVTDFASLGLAAIITTDAHREYRFGDYFGLRIVWSVVALLAIALVATIIGDDASQVAIVLALGVSMIAAMQSDIFCGLFQQRERMDHVSRSFILRGLSSLALFFVGLWATGDLLLALLGIVAANIAVFVLHDAPIGARLLRSESGHGVAPVWDRAVLLRLTRRALPLGFAAIFAALSTTTLNITRYFVVGRQGMEALGHFAVLVSLILISDRLVQPLAVSATPRLSRMFAEHRIRDFARLLARVVWVALGIGCLQLAVVVFAGEWILKHIYSPEYSVDAPEFVMLAWVSLLRNAATVLEHGILATRRFRVTLLHQVAILLVALSASHLLIGASGLRGPVNAAFMIFLLQLLTVSGLLVWCVLGQRPAPGARAA